MEPPNPQSAKFHKKHGFKIVQHAHQHEPGYVVDFMVKEITSKDAVKTVTPKPQA